jgi:predicted DCC family thiol-disulfide oxidoreductase YuxK
MHIVDERGRVHIGGDAMILLMAMQPATRRRARLARIWPPLRRRTRAEYVALADRRGELSERVGDVEATRVPPRWTRLP